MHFFVTYLRKKHQFFEADGTRENPGFESAKPGKPETRVLKYRPGSDTLVLTFRSILMEVTTILGPYSMLTIRKVVTPIRYDQLVSISAIREALKRVTIRKLDLFYAPFAMQ